MRVLIAVAVALTAHTAMACSCIVEPAPKSEFKSAHKVFLGEVVSTADGSAEMRVLENFKGASKDRIVVNTPASGASCGYGFDAPGTRHLIYASKTGVSLCSRSGPEDQASCDLRYLRNRAAWWRSPLSSLRLLRWMGIQHESCPRM